jgi:pyruvate/2-oxoglutarate dehydrogenase complex dihydrolipoamide acyltransferase (E2) component
MSVEVLLPKLGFSMSEGRVAATVTEGAPLYSLESDKSVQEIEASASGRLKILIQSGEEVYPVGTILGVIE